MELLWIVGLAAAGIGGGTWYSHNRLVALDSRCERALADIDVQLKHRHSLLPNLFETVKAFTAHERGTIEAVVTARAAALRATSPEAQLQAEAALGHASRSCSRSPRTIPSCRPPSISATCGASSPTRRTSSRRHDVS
jgi:LemA protein